MTDICEQSHTLFYTLSLLNTNTHTLSLTHTFSLTRTHTHILLFERKCVDILLHGHNVRPEYQQRVNERERESCLFIICYCLLFKHNRESLNDIVEEEEGTCFVLF